MYKLLLTLDLKDYTDDMAIEERYCVRAIIVKDGKIAMQKSLYGEYKILGGGMECGENIEAALKREVEEESGLLLKSGSARPLGEILEKRRDRFEPDKIYLNHTWFFQCETEAEKSVPNMTASEKARGYHLAWATPAEIIKANRDFMDMPWILRDTRFIEIFSQQMNQNN